MNVFVPYPQVLNIAKCLDAKRLNKQIVEANQIIDAIEGTSKAWANHPVVLMYTPHKEWLSYYCKCLTEWRLHVKALKASHKSPIYTEEVNTMSHFKQAQSYSSLCDRIRPSWLTEKYCDTHKVRLHTKDPEYYKDFQGVSDINRYILGDKVLLYIDGKQIGTEPITEYYGK